MPMCFQLFRKTDIKAGPVSLAQIDKEICEHFKVPCDDKKYYLYWFDIIGFKLACGLPFEKVIQEQREALAIDEKELDLIADKRLIDSTRRLLEIAIFLDANFTPYAFRSAN